MKIGIICPYNLYRPGGVPKLVWAWHKELRKRGHDAILIAPKPRKHEGPVEEGVMLFGTSTELNTPFRTKADVSIHAGPIEIKEYLDEQQFDILHFHEPWVPMLPLQILNKSTSINIATFHAKLPDMRVYKAIGKAAAPYARSIVKKLDYMVSVSDAAADYIQTIIEDKIDIIPNGVDLEYFDPSKIEPYPQYDDDVKTILYLNRLEKRKGPDLLLKAYRRLVKKHDDVRLIMASDGDMRSSLEAYVAAYDLPRVEFVGFVSDEEKLRLYKSADLYCAPSPYGESFGVVILEALAMQTPVLGGNNPGYAVSLAERADDYLVDTRTTTAFTKRLEELLYNEDERASYIEWSRGQAEKFGFSSMVDQYEELYTKLLKK